MIAKPRDRQVYVIYQGAWTRKIAMGLNPQISQTVSSPEH